jgi:hypothetical protein
MNESRKGNAFFSEKKGRKRISCCYARKPKMAREAVNITCRRINEATAFRNLFSRDKNPELRHPG